MEDEVTLSRRACLAALDLTLTQCATPFDIAVFVLDGGTVPEEQGVASCGHPLEWRQYELGLAEAIRQIRTVSLPCDRVLRTEGDRLVVIAKGLVDGAAVLGFASRLVHLLEDALNGADADSTHRVCVGISLSSHARASAEPLLLAAELGLAASAQARRLERTSGKRRGIRRHAIGTGRARI